MQPFDLQTSATRPETASPLPHLLLAEDDKNLRRLVALGLRRRGYSVVEAQDGSDVLQILANRALGRCSLVGAVMDVRMPGHSGLSILRALAQARDELPVVMMTAFGDEPTHRRAHEYGARHVLDKPFTLSSLCDAAERHFSVIPVPAHPVGWRTGTTPTNRPGDGLLVDRYLDVFNRAIALRRSAPRFGRTAQDPLGLVDLRVVGGQIATTHVPLRWSDGEYERVVEPVNEVARLCIEVTRQHMEDAIENPWMFYARPEMLALWQ